MFGLGVEHVDEPLAVVVERQIPLAERGRNRRHRLLEQDRHFALAELRHQRRLLVDDDDPALVDDADAIRSEEHTSELQSLMRISYAVFCLKKKKNKNTNITTCTTHIKHTSQTITTYSSKQLQSTTYTTTKPDNY